MARIHDFRPGRTLMRDRRHPHIQRNTGVMMQVACADMLDAIRSYQARRERIRASVEMGRRA